MLVNKFTYLKIERKNQIKLVKSIKNTKKKKRNCFE